MCVSVNQTNLALLFKQTQVMAEYAANARDAFVDRSTAERQLAELLPRCWEADPPKRLSIFYIVKYLQKAVKQDKKHVF